MADAVVLGDAEWRRWACHEEPLAGIARAEGPAALTGAHVHASLCPADGIPMIPIFLCQ
jgi:hypothetical protein